MANVNDYRDVFDYILGELCEGTVKKRLISKVFYSMIQLRLFSGLIIQKQL